MEPALSAVPVRCYLCGENAAVLHAPPPAELATQRRIWWLAASLREQGLWRDIVPGMNNLTVYFDPLTQDGEAVLARLHDGWQAAGSAELTPRLVEIPVHYGGEHGPDLAEVARHCRLGEQDVIAQHTAANYVVFFLGFQPGFAYMGGLPESLATPRRAEPRLAVPAGSVGIGGSQTGIYPAVSPGGWQLIGHTSLTLFDARREQPSLLLPGDSVRFCVAEGSHA